MVSYSTNAKKIQLFKRMVLFWKSTTRIESRLNATKSGPKIPLKSMENSRYPLKKKFNRYCQMIFQIKSLRVVELTLLSTNFARNKRRHLI